MKRKIPSNEKIIEQIKNIVKSRFGIESQEVLSQLVMKRLKREDKLFSVSPNRVKKLALTIPSVHVKVKTKKMPKIDKIDKCPVCESKILPLEGTNLSNKKILIGYKCVNCSYSSDLEHFMPMKYLFVWKG
ncbi:MAG: hypothetical protein J4452_04830 [Candidatus Aenigmarchaeota archaeon]|nr:hypothetical protein [Candidatus Aenigmarchaeota archaeon]